MSARHEGDILTAIVNRLMTAMTIGLIVILAFYLTLVIYPTWASGMYRLTDQQIRSAHWNVPIYTSSPWKSPVILVVIPTLIAKTIFAPCLWLLLVLAFGSSWRQFSPRERLWWCGVMVLGAWLIFATGDFSRAFLTWMD